MPMVDVDGSSLPVDLQPKLADLVWGLAATWRSLYIHQMNRVNSRNGLAMITAPETLSLVSLLLGRIARTTYVDDAHCHGTSSVVCLSVDLSH